MGATDDQEAMGMVTGATMPASMAPARTPSPAAPASTRPRSLAALTAIGAVAGWSTTTAIAAFLTVPQPTMPGFRWRAVFAAGGPALQVAGALAGAALVGGLAAARLDDDRAADAALGRLQRGAGELAWMSAAVGVMGIPMAWHIDGPVTGFVRGALGTAMAAALPMALVAILHERPEPSPTH